MGSKGNLAAQSAVDSLIDSNLTEAKKLTDLALKTGRGGVNELPTVIPVPDIPAVRNLIEHLKKAEPVREDLQRKYTAERAKRIEEFQEIMLKEVDSLSNQDLAFDSEFYRQAVRDTLAGDLGEVAWTPMMATNPISDADHAQLVRYIRDYSGGFNFEYINNYEAFLALVEGSKVPQAGQIKRLEDMFGTEMTDLIKDPWLPLLTCQHH